MHQVKSVSPNRWTCLSWLGCVDITMHLFLQVSHDIWRLLVDAVRIALNVPDVEAGILRELCERYQANFNEVLLLHMFLV